MNDIASTKVWLITGAGSGLGRATAIEAARRCHHVILSGRSRRRLEETAQIIADSDAPECAVLPINLAGATMDDYADVAEVLQSQFGRLDAMIHCAAQFTGLTPLHELKPEEMATIMHVNVTSPWLMTRALLPLMDQTSSAVAWIDDEDARKSNAFWGAYGLSKAALVKLQDSWSRELGAASSVHMLRFAPPPMYTALRRLAYPALPEEQLATPAPQAVLLCEQIEAAIKNEKKTGNKR